MKYSAATPMICSLLLMLLSLPAIGQDYVLTTRGDSLTGKVRALHFGPDKKVQITSADKEKTSLSLFQVREFSSDGDIYHPIRGEKGYVFMKLLQPGYLSLYAFQIENQARFDGLLLKKADGDIMVVPNLGFKKYVSQFLEDCPDVVSRIDEGELNKRNLTELVNAYNQCIQGRTVNRDEIIAEKEQQNAMIDAWTSLEQKVRSMEFGEKTNALEMIAEIKKKLDRKETIPNFLVEALRNSLKDTGLTPDLEQALGQLN
jgi:hypothetical protein